MWTINYLCTGYVHASRIQTMLYLCRVVNLKNIISTKVDIIRLLAVLKVVDIECHLATRSTCKYKSQLNTSTTGICSAEWPVSRHLSIVPILTSDMTLYRATRRIKELWNALAMYCLWKLLEESNCLPTTSRITLPCMSSCQLAYQLAAAPYNQMPKQNGKIIHKLWRLQ